VDGNIRLSIAAGKSLTKLVLPPLQILKSVRSPELAIASLIQSAIALE
jgi:hypothetical protein